MTAGIPFPNIDPVLIEFGPFAVRWYALAYIFGLVAGWQYMRWLSSKSPASIPLDDIDDFLTWSVLGVILGGRMGYVAFYKPEYFLENPVAILQVWNGGMSFHGGLLGVTLVTIWFARRRGINLLAFADLLACAAPIGLFMGRIANFINGELFGRITDVPWGVVFPRGGSLPRHPSQIYEAVLEGAVLFILLGILWRIRSVREKPGLIAGLFMVGYTFARAFAELFRQPDPHIGFLAAGTTMGQWLSLPMLMLGAYLIYASVFRPAKPART